MIKLFPTFILLIVGMMLGAYLALQVAVAWTKLETPPIFTEESSQL